MTKCLGQKSLDLNAKIDGKTAAEWLISDECKAKWPQKMKIAALLSKAGAVVDFEFLVSTLHTRAHAHTLHAVMPCCMRP